MLDRAFGLGLRQPEHEVVAVAKLGESYPEQHTVLCPEVDPRYPAPLIEQALGNPRGLQQLQGTRVDGDRLGMGRARRLGVDDAHRPMQPRQLERRGQSDQSGIRDQVSARRVADETVAREKPAQ